MNFRWCKVLLLLVFAVIIASPSLLAQSEIHLYGGWVRPTSSAVGQIKNNTIYGVKVGHYLDPNIELEGHLGYINQFEVKSIDPKSRGLLWEVGTNLNFSSQEFPFKRQFMPYVAFGVGGITTMLKDGSNFDFKVFNQLQLTDGTTLNTVRSLQIQSHDTFLTVSYGGGIKSARLKGPLGLRLDIRGRTLPNYYGGSPTWLEATGGINFMWGQR